MGEIRYFIRDIVNSIRVEASKPPLILDETSSGNLNCNNVQKHAQWLLDSGLWKKENLGREEAHYNPHKKQNEYVENFACWNRDGDSLEGIVRKMIYGNKEFIGLINSPGHYANIIGNFVFLGTEIACNNEGVVLIQRFS